MHRIANETELSAILSAISASMPRLYTTTASRRSKG